jgi:serine/threonine protein kinase
VAELAPGTLVAGRYRLEHLLGEGGMGAVWAATHEITGGRVALKFLKSAGDPRSDARRRFLREARAATLVDHPNVVQIRDVVDHLDTPVLVMDLLVGETLAVRLGRRGPLDVAEASRIGVQVVSAVGAAHEAGLIHRDLKPENVFLSRGAGGGEMVRVLDFGIAKLVGADGKDPGFSTAVTQSGALIGTPAYMAPEQVFGEKELDHRVDIWAIGVILHEMLTGHRPVEGENYGQIAKKLLSGPIVTVATRRPDLPDELVALVDGMLARDRGHRLGDLRAAHDVLARFAPPHGASFPPARAAEETEPSFGPAARRVDASAPTENAPTHTPAPETGPGATLVAGREPASSGRGLAAAADPSSPPRAAGKSNKLAGAAALVLAAAALAFAGLRAQRTSGAAPSPGAAATPVAGSALPAASVAPAEQAASAAPQPSPSSQASSKPSGAPAAKGAASPGKPGKQTAPTTTVATALGSATVAPAPTTPEPAAGGLVTKPPF